MIRHWYLAFGEWSETTRERATMQVSKGNWMRCDEIHDYSEAPDDYNPETDHVYYRTEA